MNTNTERLQPRSCDRCHAAGMWHLRARTLFLCNDCKRKLEWEQADVKES